MRYIDSIVTAPGEQVLHRARLHWTIFVRPSSIMTLFLLPLLQWLTTEAVVTTRRIVVASGWLTRRTFELPLSRFESIRIEQGLVARVLGFGSVLIVGVGGGRQEFASIAGPLAFRSAMEGALRGDRTSAGAVNEMARRQNSTEPSHQCLGHALRARRKGARPLREHR